MHEEQVTTNELLEFMKDNMATKDDLKAFATKDDLKAFATKDDLFIVQEDIKEIKEKMATKDELHAVRDELIGHIDGLTVKHKDHDAEITALRSRCGRIERHVGMN